MRVRTDRPALVLALAGLLTTALAACGPSSTAADASPALDAPGALDALDAGADTATGDAGDAGAISTSDGDCPSSSDAYDPYCNADARSPSTAITAPDETWTWVPFADAVCANGSATGIAVNLTHRSTHVLIYLEGGGACWDATTCFSLMTASNFGGYGTTQWNNERGTVAAAPFFDRTSATNPWADASYVFVPYCTADVHGGDHVTTITHNGAAVPTYFVGYRNMGVFLSRLVPTFAGTDRVWLSGSSAGGFGAALNWQRTQAAFGSARVDLVDDSGPPLTSSYFAQWQAAWHLQVPAGCATCATDFTALVPYLGTTLAPGHRAALLSYTMDQTISTYFGITQAQFQTQLDAFAAGDLAAIPTWKYFFLPGSTHTMLGSMNTVHTADGQTLAAWLGQMASDDAAWASAHP